ncbi:unnamed protein product [Paramecium pentaurelia]|uniref:Transmembrane protein n=1 Tax=Paramecium pentaurelia TaxID=43138 RepID=A0A8S1SVM2_9CILI|nr:unnamed protein product [Paramecium pentaurelia]
MQHFLQLVDQYVIEEKVLFSRSISEPKNKFGGIMTIILYGASLIYFLFQFIEWRSNNKLPKTTTTQMQIDDLERVWNEDVIAEIWYTKKHQDQIDPFDPQQLIYYPIFQTMPAHIQQNFKFEQIILDDGRKVNKIIFENMELIGSPYSFSSWNKVDYQLQFERCNQDLLKDGMKCADQNLYEKYQEQNNLIQVQIFIQQFNIKTKKLDKIPKIYNVNLMIGKMVYYEVQFEVNSINIDDGFLLPNSNKYQFFSNFYQLKYEYDSDYSIKHFGDSPILLIYFTMDQIKQQTLYEYPKISEILADTGSIISWILSISYFIIKYNENVSLNQMKNDILKIYFSDYQKFIIKKNCFGKIIQIQTNEKQYNKNEIIQIFQKLDSLALEKLGFKNLLQEIFKIKYLLYRILGKEEIIRQSEQSQSLEKLIEKYLIQNTIVFQKSQNQIVKLKYYFKDTLGRIISYKYLKLGI